MVKRYLVKWLAGLTIFFGLPLYFTRFIRETRFAEGFPFVFVYTWGLVAVVVLPVLLLAELYLLVWGRSRASEASEQSFVLFGSLAFCFGLVAECIFILARR
jgi:Zn-dependent protease with chaperone function